MNLPKGLSLFERVQENDTADYVILDNCIYETVETVQQWAKKFKKTLQELKFVVNLIYPCLMTRTIDKGVVFLYIF